MKCKRFEQLIPAFLDDELDNETEREFLRHIETCESCREELSIQYLVCAGLPKLETGETFHLQNELDHRIAEAKVVNSRRKKLEVYAYMYEFLTIATIIAALTVMSTFL